MLTAKNLERMIALEDRLREEYQTQIDAKTAELETCTKQKEEQTATIAKQLEQIKSLSAETSSAKKLEQQNRELHQRCENTKEEMVEIEIPAGVTDGVQLKVSGKGNDAPGDGIPGDILVVKYN